MRVIMLSMTIVLATAGAHAGPLPDAPSARVARKPPNVWLAPFRDPVFYIGSGEYAASAIADIHHVHDCTADRTCVEAYLGHDRYSYIAPQIALVTGAAYACSLMATGHHKWRWVCLAIPVAFSLTHWQDATHIYYEPREARP